MTTINYSHSVFGLSQHCHCFYPFIISRVYDNWCKIGLPVLRPRPPAPASKPFRPGHVDCSKVELVLSAMLHLLDPMRKARGDELYDISSNAALGDATMYGVRRCNSMTEWGIIYWLENCYSLVKLPETYPDYPVWQVVLDQLAQPGKHSTQKAVNKHNQPNHLAANAWIWSMLAFIQRWHTSQKECWRRIAIIVDGRNIKISNPSSSPINLTIDTSGFIYKRMKSSSNDSKTHGNGLEARVHQIQAERFRLAVKNHSFRPIHQLGKPLARPFQQRSLLSRKAIVEESSHYINTPR